MTSYFWSAGNYLSDTYNYYAQSTPQPQAPLVELSQAIQGTFDTYHTSTGEYKEKCSELFALSQTIETVVKNKGESAEGLFGQIQSAKSLHNQEGTANSEKLSNSGSLSIFKEKEEAKIAATNAALDKLYPFLQKNIVLINQAKTLKDDQSSYIQALSILSDEVREIVNQLVLLKLDDLNEQKPLNTNYSITAMNLENLEDDFVLIEDNSKEKENITTNDFVIVENKKRVPLQLIEIKTKTEEDGYILVDHKQKTREEHLNLLDIAKFLIADCDFEKADQMIDLRCEEDWTQDGDVKDYKEYAYREVAKILVLNGYLALASEIANKKLGEATKQLIMDMINLCYEAGKNIKQSYKYEDYFQSINDDYENHSAEAYFNTWKKYPKITFTSL